MDGWRGGHMHTLYLGRVYRYPFFFYGFVGVFGETGMKNQKGFKQTMGIFESITRSKSWSFTGSKQTWIQGLAEGPAPPRSSQGEGRESPSWAFPGLGRSFRESTREGGNVIMRWIDWLGAFACRATGEA